MNYASPFETALELIKFLETKGKTVVIYPSHDEVYMTDLQVYKDFKRAFDMQEAELGIGDCAIVDKVDEDLVKAMFGDK